MSDELKVTAWITGESLRWLESGGNDSRGTVPVHVRKSVAAYRGLVLREDAKCLLAERDAKIAQLERERDEAAKLFSDLSPRAVELAKRVDELQRDLGDAIALLRWTVDEIESNTCRHEDTYRGGFLWTICRDCGSSWADDQGGFQPYEPPAQLEAASAFLGRDWTAIDAAMKGGG